MGVKDIPIEVVEPTIPDTAPTEETQKKKWSDDIMNTLNKWDDDLGKFGKETAGMNIPVVIGRGAVKAMKAAVQTAQTLDDVVRAGVDYIKQSKWYQNLSQEDKDVIDENLASNAYDTIMQRGKTKEELAEERAQQKGVQQGYRQGKAEGELAGEIAGMKKGIKEGVRRGRKEEKVKAKERSAAQQKAKQANTTRKKIKKKVRAKQKDKVSVFAGDKVLLKEFTALNPLYVDNIEEYNQIAQQILDNITSPKVAPTEVTKAGRELSNQEITDYIKRQQPLQEQAKKDKLAQQYKELVDVGAIDPQTMTLAEMQEMIDKVSGEQREGEYEASQMLKAAEEKRKQMIELVRQKIRAMQFLKEKDDSGESFYEELDEVEKEVFDTLSEIDPENLTLTQLIGLNNVIENINTNGSFDGAGKYWALGQAQKNIEALKQAKQETGAQVKNDINSIKKAVSSLTMALEFIANNTKFATKLFNLSGIQGITSGYSQMNTWMRNNYFKPLKELLSKKGARNPKNVLTRGMYAFVIQHEGGTPTEMIEEFERRKELIRQDFEAKKSSRTKTLRKEGELLEEIYNEILKDATDFTQVRAQMTPDNLAIVDFHINDVFGKTKDELQQNSRIFNNQAIDEWENYTPTSYKTKTGNYDESILDPSKNAYVNNTITTRQAKAAINRQKNYQLPKDKLLNFDFDNLMERRLRDTLYEIYTQKFRQLYVEFMKQPQISTEDLLGSEGNIKFLNSQVKNMVNLQLRIYDNTNEAWDIVNKALNILMAKGARQVLAGITQPLSQALPTTVRAFMNSNFDVRIWSRLLRAAQDVDSGLFRYGSLPERKDTEAGLRRTIMEDEITRTQIQSSIGKFASTMGEKSEKVTKALFYALTQSDFASARAAWMSYYAQYMRKMGARKIDWKEEAINPNKEASAYAELMTSTTQNVNDFTQASLAARRTKGASDILRNILMPFSSFSVNNRARMMLDFQKLRTGDAKARAEASKDLGGAMAEAITFNGIKIYVLAYLTDNLGELIASIAGYDDDEIEELKGQPKTFEEKISRLFAQSATDFVVGGTGSIPETLTKDAVNWMYDEINGTSKGVIPVYKNQDDGFNWDLMGGYGIVMKNLIDTYPYIKAGITGNFPDPEQIKDEQGKMKIVYHDEPLTDRQQSFMLFYGLVNLGATIGLSDRDFLGGVRKAEKIVRKDIESTRGNVFQVEMAKKGEKEKSISGSRPTTTTKTLTKTR